MERTLKLLALLLFLAIAGSSQVVNRQIQVVTVAPSGACAASNIDLLTPNGSLYTCVNGTWTALAGGGTGTVTSVSCVSGCSVANPTTTPAITVTAGAGTVTNTGNLTALSVVVGNGTVDEKVSNIVVDSGLNNLTLPAGGILTAPGGVSSGTSPPSLTAGTGGATAAAEGTAPSVGAAAGVDVLYASSTQHGFLASFNNGSFLPLVQGPASTTSGNAVLWNSTNGGLLSDAGYVPTTNARTISTTSPLGGGGDLSANRTFTCTTCTTNASALTANLPVIGAGGQATAVGTRTGNTTQFASWTGATTAARCVDTDANGNLQVTGADCGSGGSGAAGASLFSTTGSTTVTATSPTTLIGTTTGSTTVAANTFTAGQVLQIVAQGYYSTPATPASLTITVNVGGTIRITTGAVVQIASVTNGVWRLNCMLTTRTAGASGTQIANCIFEGTGSTLTPGEAPLQTASTWTIDTTATQALDVVATWSTATGSPTITSTNVAAWIPGAPVTSVNTKTGAVALTLNSSDFANEGTTTTVLHGAAAGNPSFGAVVSADLNITTTTCTAPQVLTAISATGVGTCTAPLLTQNSQSAAYTTVLGDAGKQIYHPGADTTARTWTIDSNANVAYSIGTCITFINDTSAGVITIAITSDTLVLAGAGTTGSRTLAASNVATACKMTSTRWIISGSSGLT